eukprot:TRINITY_DN3478_c3_g1_i3.p1 TRINITY_DN3478_c3_g1~~TRINITY_DN3478_c3_g1_i3.p1  ORF type:complete len:984 (+),score=257.98 TRINITY_DN3478_c3_g1_i3:34-2985(+)
MTDKLKQLVHDTAQPDKILYSDSLELSLVTDGKSKKYSVKHIAITTHRILIFAKSKLNKNHELHKDFHILNITNVEIINGSIVIHQFIPKKSMVPPSQLFLKPPSQEVLETIMSALISAYSKVTHGWPIHRTNWLSTFGSYHKDENEEDSKEKKNIESEGENSDDEIRAKSLLPPSPSQLPTQNLGTQMKIANGWIATYKAYCNLSKVSPKMDLILYIQNCFETDTYDFVLQDCPGGVHNGKSDDLSFNLLTLGQSMKYNTYFRGLEARDVDNKQITECFAQILKGNYVISRVVCTGSIPSGGSSSSTSSNASSGSTTNTSGTTTNISVEHAIDGYDYLGEYIRSNQNHKITILQLNNIKFTSKGAIGIARALHKFPHTLRVLDLAYCNIGPQAMITLVNALRINLSMSLGIEELNLSGNQFSLESSQAFSWWIKDIRKHCALTRLSIANSGVTLGSVMLEINAVPLTYLDISDNRFDKTNLTILCHFAQTTTTTNTLCIANIGVPLDILSKTVQGFIDNENIDNIHLDISRNNIGAKGIDALNPIFRSSTKLKSLNVASNSLKEAGIISLLSSLQPSIQHLVLDKNFSGVKEDTTKLANALNSFVQSHAGLHTLSIVGEKGARLRKYIVPFFDGLKHNGTLEVLNISDNDIGESAFSYLNFCLRSNTGLQKIYADGNNIGFSGYQTFLQMLHYNNTLIHFSFPFSDLASSKNNLKLHSLLLNIYFTIEKRNVTNNNNTTNNNKNDKKDSSDKNKRDDLLSSSDSHRTDDISYSPFNFDLRWPTPELDIYKDPKTIYDTKLPKIDVPQNLFDISLSIKDILLEQELTMNNSTNNNTNNNTNTYNNLLQEMMVQDDDFCVEFHQHESFITQTRAFSSNNQLPSIASNPSKIDLTSSHSNTETTTDTTHNNDTNGLPKSTLSSTSSPPSLPPPTSSSPSKMSLRSTSFNESPAKSTGESTDHPEDTAAGGGGGGGSKKPKKGRAG